MDLELQPPQPDEVMRAVEQLLAEPEPTPDAWWQAGIDEALGAAPDRP
jgi:hypothetical protein